jgi:hypothetical protein
MGIEKILGSISPAFGAVTGRGVFGDVQKALGPAAGLAFQLGKSKRDADDVKEATAKYYRENGLNPDGSYKTGPYKKGGKVKAMAKGGKLTDLTGDGKVTRADVLKGRGVPGFKKGGSTASKRADGCATKGKTKGRFV